MGPVLCAFLHVVVVRQDRLEQARQSMRKNIGACPTLQPTYLQL
jgi:hypothetical protein